MLPEGWRRIKWGDAATLEYGKSLNDYKGKEGNTPVYGTNGLIGYTDKPLCHFPSVIIGRKGAYRGVHYSKSPFFVIDTAFYLKPIYEDLDIKFAYYQLLTQNINEMDSGSAIPSTSRNDFYNLDLVLPDLKSQQKISSILSSLDDKIELNLKMNQTLEAIAQAIFKEWFIDFRFPGFDGELVDGLPKRWRVGKVGEIADVIDCLHSKKPERVSYDTGFILLQLNNILDNGLLDLSDKFYISQGDYQNWISRIEISEGDCIITNVGRVGSVARIPALVKAALGRNMTGIRPKENYPYPTFLVQLLVSNFMKTEIEKKKDFGTILDALNVKNIPKLSFHLPNIELISQFESIVSPMRSRMENNVKENLTLSSIRDMLLPKLMTGKIRVA